MAAFYGTPQFRGFDLSSILNPQAGDDVGALLEQGKRKEFLSKTKYPTLKTLSFTPEPEAVIPASTSTTLPPPPPPPPQAKAPTPTPAQPTPQTWQGLFSDAERAGVTGQNAQSTVKSSEPEFAPDWRKGLATAAKAYGNRPEGPKAPEVRFTNPGPLRSTPITKGLPDPVLFALFGKPV